ncbi:LysR family transcriptional regulator [Microvirga sp. 2YAF29]|uniref:LysR family transcriptional regulator n=1 Tax=Microvirga sp. 2YAF29 TaxID=3233031 RepID=UPI003F946F78
METRFLETFVQVVQLGSLAEASRRLGITPAAVAQRITALEEEIGMPLLVRAGRRVKPTEAGRSILEHSSRVLSDVRRLRFLAQQDQASGELRLGAISTALTGMLPPALRFIFDNMPNMEVFLLPGTSADLYQSLMDEKIDAAILVRPPFPIPKTLEWKTLRSEKLILMAPRAFKEADPHELLRSQPFIRYDRSNWGGRLVDHYLQQNGILPRDWLELDSLEAIAVMVANGLGVSLLPDWSAPWQETMNIVRLDMPEKSASREVGLLWPRNAPAGRLVQIILDALAKGP